MSLVAAYGTSSDEESDTEMYNTVPKPEIKATLMNKTTSSRIANFSDEEEDDEYLHKKVDQSLIERPTINKKDGTKEKVKIMIPSLSSFQDDGNISNRVVNKTTNKFSGLLGMLPPPRSGVSFLKTDDTNDSSEITKKLVKASVTSLVPDTVRKRNLPTATRTSNAKKSVDIDEVEDEAEEGSSGDFFGVFKEESIPQVNNEEIIALVRKRAARMNGVEKPLPTVQETTMQWESSQVNTATQHQENVPSDLHTFIGRKGTKRKHQENIQFIDISQDQLTNKEEWMTHSLQAETEYQPRGLIDPATGTKKKHQITYLAHQAKANEQELQSMWSANRHAKMQTQSKYGF